MQNIYKTKSMVKINKESKEFNPSFKSHEISLFKHFLFCGGTGLGKSNAVINLLLAMQGCFSHVQIYTADPNEPLYRMLKEKLKDNLTIEEIGKIPHLSEQKKGRGQQLLIIDDFITAGKKVMAILEEYAIRSRKDLFTCCFLTQSYYACPIKIRQQIRYLVLLKLCDKRNFNMIVSSLDSEIDPAVIRKVIKNATGEALNVALIDLQARDENKLIRRNFGLEYYKLANPDGSPIANPKLLKGSGIVN